MAKKRIRTFGKSLSPYDLLSNSIASLTMSDENFRQVVADFISTEPDATFEVKFKQLFKFKRFKLLFAANSKSIEQFSLGAFLMLGLPIQRLWRMYRCLLKISAAELTEFANYRDQIERRILTGDYKNAEKLLGDFLAIFGESLWYVRTRMLILLGQEKTDEFREFCEDCKARAGETLTGYILHCFQLITDSDNPAIILQSLIFRTTSEFKEAKFHAVASLLETLFVPYPLKRTYSYMDCLSRIQALPIIDQYTLLTSILRLAAVESKELQSGVLENLDEVLNDLNSQINDPYLNQITDTYFGKTNYFKSSAGSVLLANYERGNYSAVIREFDQLKDDFQNPLAYVNLVAKATAQLSLPSDVTLAGSLLQKLTGQLTTIYKLEPLWAQAEEAIVSSAIKYHYFRCSPHIQLSLYKVLPNRYISASPEMAAALAIATDPEATPLTSAMIRSEKVTFGARDQYFEVDVPIYRTIKREISSAILSANEKFDYQANFRLLESLIPLKKDYFELFSEYCLQTEQEDLLVNVTAKSLVENFNNYVCFPLEQLIEVIEQGQLCSIEAVITAYYFNRYVSQDRDYVLHESFEEYLHTNGVRKPSDILISMSNLTDLEIVFYREVCSPEVMDFLSCFKNTNDLRTERVRILDLLLELGVVDTDDRMREVEEIVGRVIIDAGTSDFNGPKINVDEHSLRKKHAEEMKALLALYRQAKDVSEDRFTLLGDDFKKNGMIQAYVSGNKNTTVLKMFQIISEAFQYDEKYGLDKNLSAEIRHGFFSNLMRACLEERKLITEVNESGQYKENLYWREVNALLTPTFWEEIDGHLKNFSANFNQLVVEAEEWMKIVRGSDQPNRIFSFVLGKEEFEATKEFIENVGEPDKIASFILQNMWAKTEVCLSAIRDKLNGEFRDRVDALFEQLEMNIKSSKREVALLELMNAIGHARGEIKEDITTAAEWFRRAENTQLQTRTLDQVIEIAISSFEQVKGGASAIEKLIPLNLRSIQVPGNTVKPFIIAITNLLDNCYRRSGLGYATIVEVKGALSDNGARITIKNNLSAEKTAHLTEDLLGLINHKIHSPEARSLVRSEGGSGLIKAYNEISSTASRSDLSVSRTDTYFCAEIYYEP